MRISKETLVFLFLILNIFSAVFAQPGDSEEELSIKATGPWIPDLGNGKYKNPVIYADYSDPDVVRTGSSYYMTSSSFNSTPGLQVLHSKDLVNWELVGKVFDVQVPVEVYSIPKPANGVWAPAIRFHNDTFYITWGDPDYGVYIAKSKRPEGPWDLKLIKSVKGWIDVCPFWDSNGEGYIIHAYAKSRIGFNSILTIRRLSKDCSQIYDSIMVVDGNKISPELLTTIEGPKLYKKGSYYYILAPAGGVTNGWQLALRATSLSGPWEFRKIMEQGRSIINGPHQGAWLTTPDEKQSWFLHFQDKGAYGRIVHLQPMKWIDNWPVIGEDPDNDGLGTPVFTAEKPDVGIVFPISTPATSDKFNSDTLGLQWQWYGNSKPGWMSLTANEGYLRLYCVALPTEIPDYKLVPNLLLQKLCSDSFSFTTKIYLHLNTIGERAGVIVVGGMYSFVSVVKKADGLYISYSSNDGIYDTKLYSSIVYLRVEIEGPDATCKFGYSTDGKNFTQVGTGYTATNIRWIGAKIGIFASKPYGLVSDGFADFAWVKVE